MSSKTPQECYQKLLEINTKFIKGFSFTFQKEQEDVFRGSLVINKVPNGLFYWNGTFVLTSDKGHYEIILKPLENTQTRLKIDQTDLETSIMWDEDEKMAVTLDFDIFLSLLKEGRLYAEEGE